MLSINVSEMAGSLLRWWENHVESLRGTEAAVHIVFVLVLILLIQSTYLMLMWGLKTAKKPRL